MKGRYFIIILNLLLAFSFFGFAQNAEIKFNLVVANNGEPRIVVSDLSIDNSPVFPGRESSIKKPIEEADEIDLRYNQNNLFFRISVFDSSGSRDEYGIHHAGKL